MTRLWTSALLASLLCSSCMVGPKYQRPVAPTPLALKEIAGNDQWKMATPSDALIKGKWWEIFGDPELNRLEELVNVNNQNVKQAEANFRQARAVIAGNRANYFPIIGANPSITQSDTGSNGGRAGGTSQTFSLPAVATWEPDLWGRVRLSVENAVNNAQVSAADLENVRLSAQALLASDYFLLAAQDMQLAILRDTIDAYEKNLQLTINRFNGGVASRSDITLAQTQLAGAQSPEHGDARHPCAIRTCHRRAHRTTAFHPRHWRQQDRRSAAANSPGGSLSVAGAASRHCRQ